MAIRHELGQKHEMLSAHDIREQRTFAHANSRLNGFWSFSRNAAELLPFTGIAADTYTFPIALNISSKPLFNPQNGQVDEFLCNAGNGIVLEKLPGIVLKHSPEHSQNAKKKILSSKWLQTHHLHTLVHTKRNE